MENQHREIKGYRELNEAEIDIDNLRHMLGVQKGVPKRDHGWRNYFAAGPCKIAAMERLVDAGFVVRGAVVRGADSYQIKYYHATVAGCEAIGMSKAAIKRALKP